MERGRAVSRPVVVLLSPVLFLVGIRTAPQGKIRKGKGKGEVSLEDMRWSKQKIIWEWL